MWAVLVSPSAEHLITNVYKFTYIQPVYVKCVDVWRSCNVIDLCAGRCQVWFPAGILILTEGSHFRPPSLPHNVRILQECKQCKHASLHTPSSFSFPIYSVVDVGSKVNLMKKGWRVLKWFWVKHKNRHCDVMSSFTVSRALEQVYVITALGTLFGSFHFCYLSLVLCFLVQNLADFFSVFILVSACGIFLSVVIFLSNEVHHVRSRYRNI